MLQSIWKFFDFYEWSIFANRFSIYTPSSFTSGIISTILPLKTSKKNCIYSVFFWVDYSLFYSVNFKTRSNFYYSIVFIIYFRVVIKNITSFFFIYHLRLSNPFCHIHYYLLFFHQFFSFFFFETITWDAHLFQCIPWKYLPSLFLLHYQYMGIIW